MLTVNMILGCNDKQMAISAPKGIEVDQGVSSIETFILPLRKLGFNHGSTIKLVNTTL